METHKPLITKDRWQANVERLERNVRESPLRELEYLGVISPQCREAGELFEADVLMTRATGGTRDSLDMTPRGGSYESPAQVERIKRAKDRLKKVKAAAGPLYASLLHIAVDRKPLKMAGAVMPGLLLLVGRVYGLGGKA